MNNLFQEVAWLRDIAEKENKKGDVATIVDHHQSSTSEDGNSLEVFKTIGETIAVVAVSESEIDALKESEVFNVRSLEAV